MTYFIKLEDGKPVGNAIIEENLRMLFPDVEFPKLFTPDVVEPHGYGLFEVTSPPTPEKFKKSIELPPVKNDHGIYVQTWEVVDMTEEEKQISTDNMAFIVRRDRNAKLYGSDWSQLEDAPLNDQQKTGWKTYRQELRDVPAQSGFPWDVIWPSRPE